MPILIYTSSTCPHCTTAKDYLNKNHLKFEEKNVSTDALARSEMQSLGAMGVPTLVVNGQMMVGFNPQELQKLLLKQVIPCPNCHGKIRLPADKGTLDVACPKCQHRFRVPALDA